MVRVEEREGGGEERGGRRERIVESTAEDNFGNFVELVLSFRHVGLSSAHQA